VRETAARLADAKLHELALTGAWQSGESTGVFEDWADYNWEMATEDWTEDDEAGTAMTLLSVTVSTVAVGAEQSAVLTTLVQGSSE